MLLKSFVASLIVFSSFAAQAQKIQTLSAGTYVATSGPQHLCGSFSLSDKDASAKTLALGAQYSYETRNSNRNTQSDLDESCEFREQNTREDRSQEVVLTRTNEEVCKGNVSSRTFSRATVTSDEIQIRHEIDGAVAYTCIFKKQTK